LSRRNEAETAVERELVLRLASLLWRLRRATSIETGLLQIEEKDLHEPTSAPRTHPPQDRPVATLVRPSQQTSSQSHKGAGEERDAPVRSDAGLEVARRFLRLADLDNGVFERLGRYEAALWRQIRQTLFTLEALRWGNLNARRPRMQFSWRRMTEPSPSED
jgi:hypothetical protein